MSGALFDKLPYTLDDQIQCVQREIDMRRHVYAHRVEAGKMKRETADREIALMSAVLATLKEVKNERTPGR